MHDNSRMNKNQGQIFIKIKLLNYFKALHFNSLPFY